MGIDITSIIPEICPDTTLYDDYYHRPFMTTNEAGHQEALGAFSVLPPRGDTVVGVSCFATLNIAAVRPIDTEKLTIVAIDRGVRVLDFWVKTAKIILEAKNRSEFIESVVELYFDNQDSWGSELPENLSYRAPVEGLCREIFRDKTSWLSSNAFFRIIQRVFQKNNSPCFVVILLEVQM